MRRLYEILIYSIIVLCLNTYTYAQLSDALSLTASIGSKSDETIIRFIPVATDYFDGQFDAYKFKNPTPTPNLYTVCDVGYAINTLNNQFTKKIVKLNFEAAFPGTYSITAKEIGPFEQCWSIVLVDLVWKKEIDLRKNPVYKFIAIETDKPNRFYIKFEKVMCQLF